ncbi:MAG TPA: Dabb family protein [Prolixibacteraceae bacterium]|nr:Dabb family protein [Prolixibacteraceae bacterium]
MENNCYFCTIAVSQLPNNYLFTAMFNHIVLFKLKDFQNDQLKAETRDQIKNALLGLKEKIAGLKYIEVGNNFELNAASFDLSLVTRFDSYDEFLVYRDHPEHQKVVGLVRANTVDRAVVDYVD